MKWTLDQNLFRYLIGLYALSMGLALVCVLYESLRPNWSQFSDDFDVLVTRHFGAQNDAVLLPALVVACAALVWHVASLFGLRNFRPWARWSFWASMVLGTIVIYGAEGFRPAFQTPLESVVTEISTGFFAAIVLLSYSSEHGAVWFRKPLETLRETF